MTSRDKTSAITTLSARVAREIRRLVEPDFEQHLEEFAAQFAPFVIEEFLGLAVGEHNAAGRIDHADAIQGGFEQVAEFGFNQFP